jgi:hypothetical protein
MNTKLAALAMCLLIAPPLAASDSTADEVVRVYATGYGASSGIASMMARNNLATVAHGRRFELRQDARESTYEGTVSATLKGVRQEAAFPVDSGYCVIVSTPLEESRVLDEAIHVEDAGIPLTDLRKRLHDLEEEAVQSAVANAGLAGQVVSGRVFLTFMDFVELDGVSTLQVRHSIVLDS